MELVTASKVQNLNDFSVLPLYQLHLNMWIASVMMKDLYMFYCLYMKDCLLMFCFLTSCILCGQNSSFSTCINKSAKTAAYADMFAFEYICVSQANIISRSQSHHNNPFMFHLWTATIFVSHCQSKNVCKAVSQSKIKARS